MKNRLLPLFVVLASFSARSQVGIGTKTPISSAQLEVTTTDIEKEKYGGSNKGILIPRVELTSTVVYAPIIGAEANSLLVFNTNTTGDVTPGYYFWLNHKWNRLAVSGESGSGTGKDGIDGIPGVDGLPGTAGLITTLNAIVKDSNNDIYAYVGVDNTVAGRDKEWAEKSSNWVKISGKNGLNGNNGINGGNGLPGAR